jgi:glyoxylase-like metal-dependent hydrolase (beta-lactamase superfamily II)
MRSMTTIHRFTGSPDTVPVNAYVIEGPDGVVVVDGTLTVSGGRALKARTEATGKPLAGVLVTHAHPDHYGGLVELGDVPIYAVAGVADVIRRDDDTKEQILRPMFGDEWPQQRMFPNRAVSDGETLEFGGASFTVIDLGPSESPHDSIWLHGCRAPWHSPAPAPSSTVA